MMIDKTKKALGNCFAPLIGSHPTMEKMTLDFREDDLANSVKALLKNGEKDNVVVNYGGAHDMSRAFEKAGLTIERNEVSKPDGSGEAISIENQSSLEKLKLGLSNAHLIGNHLYCVGKLKLGKFDAPIEQLGNEMERLDKLHFPSTKAEKDKK